MAATATPLPQLTGRMLRRKMTSQSSPAVGSRGAAAPAPAPAIQPAVVDPRIAAIQAAEEGAEIVLGELLHRSDTTSTADQLAQLQPEIELARITIDDCTQKEIDLNASLNTISLPDPAIVAKLQSLAASIDDATVRSAIVNATLAGLADVLNSAIRINALV